MIFSLISSRSERFVILPPKENVEEEIRPRPASLRQQPKRRFSTYIPSPQEFQPSTSNAQPPISLRLKRISDPLSDEQKMPPPKLTKVIPVRKPEKVDLNALNLMYMCNYCKMQVDSFDKIHAHWLSIHKKGNTSDPIAKRFAYRITKRVKCVYCPIEVTFQTIRAHMEEYHTTLPYAFAKYESNQSGSVQCGICSTNIKDISALQAHFRSDHPQSQRPDTKIEPMPMINDSVLEVLLQQGDRGTFKCVHCSRHFPCRYDYDEHHKAQHATIIEKYEINGKDVVKYSCNVCREMYTDENAAIDHWRTHVQQWYQCLFCPKKVQYLKLIQTHHQLIHNSTEIGYRIVNAHDNLNSLFQITLTFSNGLSMIWGDVLNTKYGGVERLVSYVNQLNEQQRQQQLKTSKATSNTNTPKMAIPAAKIGSRRQTHL